MSSTESLTTADWARTYIALGYAPVEVFGPKEDAPGVNSPGKQPVHNKWQHMRLKPEDVDRVWAPGSQRNIGLILGVGGLVDIDLDCEQALHFAYMLPPTGWAFGRSGAILHYLYTIPEHVPFERFHDPAIADNGKNTLIEFRSAKVQTVVPPSIHPSGAPLQWRDGGLQGDPPTVDGKELHRIAGVMAAGCLLARHWPGGNRHDAALALAGGLLRAGWTVDDASAFIAAICAAAKDDETPDRLKGLESTLSKLETGEPATGWPRLEQLIPTPFVIARVIKYLGIKFRREAPKPTLEGGFQFEDISQWLDVAEAFADSFKVSGVRSFLRFQERWWRFRDGAWRQIEELEMRTIAYQWLRTCKTLRAGKKDEPPIPVPVPLTQKNIAELLSALSATVSLTDRRPPLWLEGDGPDPLHIACFENGWIDTREYADRDPTDDRAPALHPPDPRLFTLGAAPYPYDHSAKCPVFLNFLGEVLNDDERDIATCHEWVGYCLTPWNGMEKAFFAEGHACSGKSTFLGAIRDMLGHSRCASTTLTKLGTRFGLEPLTGKMAVMAADAHMTKSGDAASTLETFKLITGNDDVSVDRKGLAEVASVRIHAKFSLAINQMPNLRDGGASLRRRILIVRFPNNYEGNEDRTLKGRIADEAQGIAVWALQGLRELLRKGVFTESQASLELKEEFVRNSTPILSFIDECCSVSVASTCPLADIFKVYVCWCRENGIQSVMSAGQLRKALSDAHRLIDSKRLKRGWSMIGVAPTPDATSAYTSLHPFD